MMNKMNRILKSLLFMLAFVVAMTMASPAVVEVTSPRAVKSVSLKVGNTKVTKKTYNVKKGKTAVLKVVVSPAKAKKSVTFTSGKKKIATVSKSGKITGKKNGTVKITVRVKGKNGKYKSTWMKVKVYTPAKTSKKMTQTEAKNRLMRLKKTYPEGKSWGDDKAYYWKATNTYGLGCYAYIAQISDKVFGKSAKVTRHRTFSKIKVGDHIRVGTKIFNQGYHSVIVLSKKGNTITVTEGNFNSSVHWGRKITLSELSREGFYVETRY